MGLVRFVGPNLFGSDIWGPGAFVSPPSINVGYLTYGSMRKRVFNWIALGLAGTALVACVPLISHSHHHRDWVFDRIFISQPFFRHRFLVLGWWSHDRSGRNTTLGGRRAPSDMVQTLITGDSGANRVDDVRRKSRFRSTGRYAVRVPPLAAHRTDLVADPDSDTQVERRQR